MKKFTIDFVSKRLFFASLSGLFVLVSIALLATKGLTFGIDFSGGTLLEFRTYENQTIQQVRAKLDQTELTGYTLQEYGAQNEFVVKLADKISDNAVAENIVAKLGAELRRLEYVGPQIGKELAEKGLLATIVALIAILIYISARFQLRFALGAVIALFHDVVVTLGMFVVLGKEFSLPVLAAVLTIIGYSLNDTIVVYDRIRENMEDNDDEDNLGTTINRSINETLRRTLITSITTFVVLLSLYLFGGQSINDFAFTLLFGVVVGTYSSIFVASPVLLYLRKLAPKPKQEQEAELEDFTRFNEAQDD